MKLAPAIFFSKFSKFAIINQILYGVPASITLSQAALESGWAGSGLTEIANNFFGIKNSSSWNGPTYSTSTGEYYDGNYTTVNADFRAYKSPFYSFKDHSKFLRENQRYSELFTLPVTDYTGWAVGLQNSGYATSPTYANKLINLINLHDLSRYDRQAQAIKYIAIGTVTIGIIYAIKRIIDTQSKTRKS